MDDVELNLSEDEDGTPKKPAVLVEGGEEQEDIPLVKPASSKSKAKEEEDDEAVLHKPLYAYIVCLKGSLSLFGNDIYGVEY